MAKTYNLKRMIMSKLREVSRFCPARKEILKRAKVATNSYRCIQCNLLFIGKGIKADHIEPVVPVTGFTDWQDIIERFGFENIEKWQALCYLCHQKKTNYENEQRRVHKRLAAA